MQRHDIFFNIWHCVCARSFFFLFVGVICLKNSHSLPVLKILERQAMTSGRQRRKDEEKKHIAVARTPIIKSHEYNLV